MSEIEKMYELDKEYKDWLIELKSKIRSSQAKAAVVVNSALIQFYWELGKMIAKKISASNWGDKILAQVANDLKDEFPEMKGLSRSNLFYAKQFYEFYQPLVVQRAVGQLQNAENQIDEIVQQAVGQIPWGHNILIFSKSENINEANFFIQQTIENAWSRDVLALQIKSQLYQRQGKAISNFKNTLPEPFSDLAQQTLKDPYVFDFLSMSKPFHEKDIERQLINHITKFLLELGKGFAFIGQQYHLEVGETDYYIDLLLPYQVKMLCSN